MSAAPFRKRYTGAPRSSRQITDEDLKRHGIDTARPPAKPNPPAPAKAANVGNPKLWRTLQILNDAATGTKKTTRILALPGGVIVNTCTRGPAGMCEALVFVPGVASTDFPAA